MAAATTATATTAAAQTASAAALPLPAAVVLAQHMHLLLQYSSQCMRLRRCLGVELLQAGASVGVAEVL
jgi:hypothetical protein